MKTAHYVAGWLLALSMVAGLAAEPRRIKLETREVLLGKLPSNVVPKTPTVSPDASRLAYVVLGTNQQPQLFVDGALAKPYGVTVPGGPVFSPDSRRIAWPLVRDGMMVVVVNGVEEKKRFESIAKYAMSFSPDSQRIAYVAGPSAGTMCMMVGDVESAVYNGIGTSPDGNSPGRGTFWSPDSKHYAFNAARSPSQWLLVRDGVETATFDRLKAPVFSPDSQHLAWAGKRGTKAFVVRDGKEGKPYEEVLDDTLVFSPDSQQLVYCGRRAGKDYLVVDGVEVREHDALLRGGPVFSPDGKSLAYAVVRGMKRFLIVNGQEAHEYDWDLGYPVFSPDSKRLAFYLEANFKTCAVVDGVQGKSYSEIAGLQFSPDSRHCAYWACRGACWVVVADEVESDTGYNGSVASCPLAFDGPTTLRGAAFRDNQIFRVEVKILEE